MKTSQHATVRGFIRHPIGWSKLYFFKWLRFGVPYHPMFSAKELKGLEGQALIQVRNTHVIKLLWFQRVQAIFSGCLVVRQTTLMSMNNVSVAAKAHACIAPPGLAWGPGKIDEEIPTPVQFKSQTPTG